ncbi:MAG: energy-coupling factor transporter transmembrane protein EcfT [Chlorobium sp.]|nr:energy-coupling factor transporter transmembrane protein EcfT [Chlorobium sp.]
MKIEGNRTACDDTGYQCLPAPVSGLLGGDLSALVVTVLFLFSVLSIPKFNLSEVVVFAAFPLFLMGAARVSSGAIAKRLLQLSPFVLFMAAGNLLLDRTPLMHIFGITFSGGMISGTVIVAKTIISVAGLLSVTSSIPFYRICRALEAFRVPDVLITQLILLDRYRSVLHEEAQSMLKARNIRSFGRKGKELFRTAPLIGSLLLRTTNRAERLYRSMSARGFHGRIGHSSTENMNLDDWKTIGLWFIFFLALRLIF